MKQAVFKALPKNPLHLSSHGELDFIMSNKRQYFFNGFIRSDMKKAFRFFVCCRKVSLSAKVHKINKLKRG